MAISGLLKGLVFDLDGTLVQTDAIEATRRIGDRAGAQAGLAKTSVDPKIKKAVVEAAKHVPIGVVTDSPSWYAQMVLGHHFPGLQFTSIVPAGATERAKPYPDPIEKALKEMGIAPKDAEYFGDTRKDIEAAYHAGVRQAACRWFSKDPEAHRLCPDAVLENDDDFLEYLERPSTYLPLVEQQIIDPTNDRRKRRRAEPASPHQHRALVAVG